MSEMPGMPEMKQNNSAAPPPALPCAVYQDLMPLVQDGVASPESAALLQAHLAVCPACRALWEQTKGERPPTDLPEPDDIKTITKIRWQFNRWAVGLGAIGMVLGWLITYTPHNTFLLLIIPLASGAAYWWDARVAKPLTLATLAVSFLSTVVSAVRFRIANGMWESPPMLLRSIVLMMVLVWSACALGMLVARLLKFALQGTPPFATPNEPTTKEKKDEPENKA